MRSFLSSILVVHEFVNVSDDPSLTTETTVTDFTSSLN